MDLPIHHPVVLPMDLPIKEFLCFYGLIYFKFDALISAFVYIYFDCQNLSISSAGLLGLCHFHFIFTENSWDSRF